MTYAEAIWEAVRKLAGQQGDSAFSREDVRQGLGVSKEDWHQGYTSIFQRMREDHPGGGTSSVVAKFKGVFRRVAHGTHRLSEYGKKFAKVFSEEDGPGEGSTQRGFRAEEADSSGSGKEDEYARDGVDRRPLVQRQIRERRGQQQFRDALRERYGDRCQVTGCKILAVLEAAHISPYRGEKDNHPDNGLLLRSDVHTLFDLDLLGIEPETLQVELHPSISEEYAGLARPLSCPNDKRPSPEALRLRYERFGRQVGSVP